jgi:hypothetical protein
MMEVANVRDIHVYIIIKNNNNNQILLSCKHAMGECLNVDCIKQIISCLDCDVCSLRRGAKDMRYIVNLRVASI